MSTPESNIVDSALLSRLAGLNFRLGRSADGTLTGHHRSPLHGTSVEFAQHREYVPGDEIRHMDWKSFARSDRLYVKQFEDETNLRVHLIMDTSGSMGYCAEASRESKLIYASRLASAIAWLFIRQGDSVGLLTVGHQVENYVPPRASPEHFWRIVKGLEACVPTGETRLTNALRYIAESAGRRGLVILLTDCLDFEESFAALARQLQSRSHDVLVLHVLDPAEIEFPFDELTLFESMENDERLQVDPRSLREEYLRGFAAWEESLRRGLRSGRVGYRRIKTSLPLESCILEMLAEDQQ